MFKRSLVILCLVLAALAASGIGGALSAYAAGTQLYSQYSDSGNAQFSCSPCEGSTEIGADDFIVPASTTWTINEVDFRGTAYVFSDPSTFTIIIYQDNGGQPGTVISSQPGLTATRSGGISEPYGTAYDYAVTLPSGVNLSAGHYWVSVVASSSWYWEMSSTDYNTTGVSSFDGVWYTATDKMFTLVSTVATVMGTTGSCSVLTPCTTQVATITDADGDACTHYTATVNWGDGSSSTGTVSGTNATTGCAVTGTHTYASPGTFTTVISVTDSDGVTASATGRISVTQATTKSPCKNYVCPSAQAKFNSNGASGSFKVAEGTNGALTGTIQYSDSANPSATIPGCYTGSTYCNFAVSSFTCTGTTAQVYGTVTVNGAVRQVHLTLSGTTTTTGTFTIQESWTGGSRSRTVTGYGIVAINCP